MKRTEFREVTVANRKFYIYPFGALKAANLSGELVKLLAPALGSLGAVIDTKDGEKSIFDYDIREIAPAIAGAFGSLSGDAVELLLKKLLIINENVAYETDDGKAVRLTEGNLDELFCGEVQGLYVLAFEVVRTNYAGFFGKLGSLFGNASDASTTKTTE